jgi:hypothetical protein
MRHASVLLALFCAALAACHPPATTPVAPLPQPSYVPAYRTEGAWIRVQAPDGQWSELREGLDCAALAPGQWQPCNTADGRGLSCHPVAECGGAAPSGPAWTQPGTHPSAQEVAAFTTWIAGRCHAQVFDKRSAPLMRVAAVVLQVLGIQQPDFFLSSSATTIPLPGPNGAIASIYLPYTPGVEVDDWILDVQVGAIAHECEHALQYAREGAPGMAWRYITSPRHLVEYEVEAREVQRAYLTWRGAVGYPPEYLADSLREYGVGPRWVAYARALSVAVAVPVERGALVTASWRLARAWLEAHAPELRGVQVQP